MGETMAFPATWREFIKAYSFFDEKKEYTNGAELITVLRVRQMVEHYLPPPVKHGTWLERADGRYGQWRTYCSVCGKHSGIGGIKQKPPYCPNCGAKMDGGAGYGTA